MPDGSLMSILAVILSSYFIAIGSVYLKKGSESLSFNFREILKNEDFLIGSSMHLLSGLIFLVALRFNEVSILYPLSATSYALVAIMSRKYLDEKVGKFNWYGIVLITIGVILIGMGGI